MTYVAVIDVLNSRRYKVGGEVPAGIFRGQTVEIPDGERRVPDIFVPADSPAAVALLAELDWRQKHDAAVTKALAKLGFKTYAAYCAAKTAGSITKQSADEKALVALLAERPPDFRPAKTVWQRLAKVPTPKRTAQEQDPFAP